MVELLPLLVLRLHEPACNASTQEKFDWFVEFAVSGFYARGPCETFLGGHSLTS